MIITTTINYLFEASIFYIVWGLCQIYLASVAVAAITAIAQAHYQQTIQTYTHVHRKDDDTVAASACDSVRSYVSAAAVS